MATPNSSRFRRNSNRERSSASSISSTPFSSSLLKRPVFLHEWWLIKADSSSQGGRLGVGGFTVHEKQVERMFFSAPIVKRHDSVTLETVDSIKILVSGFPNKSFSLKNGFSHRVCDHFAIGFPYDWEEYASLSFLEDENPTHDSEDHESAKDILGNIMALLQKDGHTFESSVRKETSPVSPAKGSPKNEGEAFASSVKEKTSPVTTANGSPMKHMSRKDDLKRKGGSNVDGIKLSGPLTRSRSRKLDN